MAREAVEAFCASSGFDKTAVGEIGLCVNEAMANSIRQAYDNAVDKPTEIRASYDGTQVTIEIRDWGNGIDPTGVPEKRDPMTPGGLGLVCLRKMLDEAIYQ